MGFVQTDGCRLYYERHGQGPAIAFCHGAGSNAATWWQQVPYFARRFTCLTLDQRCFGRSRAAAHTLGWEALVADLLAVLDAEGIERVALVCQSLGGGLGLRFALAHPQRVRALVSSGSSMGIDLPEARTSVARYLASAEGGRVEQRALGPAFQDSASAFAFLYQQINGFNPLVLERAGAELRSQLAALNSEAVAVPLEQLRRVACPVLLMGGEFDPLMPPALIRAVSAHFPRAQAAVVAGCGHSPYFERPAEFNGQVERFLDQASSAHSIASSSIRGRSP
jgi:pimeloyl-ACP methyl ester carboxylesterase